MITKELKKQLETMSIDDICQVWDIATDRLKLVSSDDYIKHHKLNCKRQYIPQLMDSGRLKYKQIGRYRYPMRDEPISGLRNTKYNMINKK